MTIQLYTKKNITLSLKLNKFYIVISIFIILTLIIAVIITYLPLNPDDGSVITKNYKLKNAFPNLKFDNPVDFQIARDNTTRIFVVEQKGRIVTFENDVNVSTKHVFLDIQERVAYGGEMGLLGLAFHPLFTNNGYIFVDYTSNNPRRTVISRFMVNKGDANTINKSSELIILEVSQPYANHNGGQVAFGHDGYLYIALGDGGLANDPQDNGQDLSTLLGSLLRIDIDNPVNELNYGIPYDNPFIGNSKGYREEIYAYGLRNPWRFSFDSITQKLWVADVGQNRYEEINIVEKGKNYGWNEMEGKHCLGIICDKNGLENPIVEYNHNQGISVTGGFVYRGTKLAKLYGYYIYADFGSGRIWKLKINENGEIENELLLKDPKQISSFGIDENNELFICSLNGEIYEIIPN